MNSGELSKSYRDDPINAKLIKNPHTEQIIMINLLYKNSDFEAKFIECMEKYDHYYWATAWSGHGFHAYELLKKNKSKIAVLATGVYGTDGYAKTSKEFMGEFIGTKGVYFLGYIDRNKYKGMNPLHSKEYLFYTDDAHWEIFIGSANFTNAGFHNNHEAVLHFDQDSGNIEEIMPFFTSHDEKDESILHYRTLSRKTIRELSK